MGGRIGSDKPKATHASAEPGSGSFIITKSMESRNPPSSSPHRDTLQPMQLNLLLVSSRRKKENALEESKAVTHKKPAAIEKKFQIGQRFKVNVPITIQSKV